MKTFITRSTGLLALVVLFGVAQTTHAQNVVETAQGVDDLSTLVELVVAADLVDTLSNAEDITVFAPTNDAFEKLPNVLFRAIENDPDILVSILTYHVAPERLRAEDVIETSRIDTLQGSDIRVRTAGNNVFLNSSRVTATDIEADNATVHTINKVLIPWRDILRDVVQALRHR